MVSVSAQESYHRSEEFFADPNNYSLLTSNVIDCIEPRNRSGVTPGQFPVTIQTPGGGGGETVNAAVVQIAQGESVSSMTVERSARRDKRNRPLNDFWLHAGCLYMGAVKPVLAEQAEPSDLTTESLGYFAARLGMKEAVRRHSRRLQAAAARLLEYFDYTDTDTHLFDQISNVHPEVHEVEGENTSCVYLMNLDPFRGQDRNMKRGLVAEVQGIQGYHDSLAASKRSIGTAQSHGVSKQEIEARRVASLFSSVATRTVVTAGKLANMTFFIAEPVPGGLRIIDDEVIKNYEH